VRDLNEVFVFVTVVDQKGFSSASRALKLPKSSVSRYVGRLEARLGTRLLERSTRSIRLTDAGRTFYERCKGVLAELDAAETDISENSSSPRGVVRVSCPTGLSQQILSHAVPVFMRRYPLIRLHIRVTNRPVSLVEDGIDVAVRARPRLKDEAVTMRKLRTSRLIFVASPAFNTSHSILREPKSLAKLPMLSFQEDAERPRWRLIGPNNTASVVSFDPVLWSSDLSILREAPRALA
jgi:DNA-binding transcriptional LysR family regulator